jgi:hypothetical protein
MKANIITGAGPVDAIPGGVVDGIDYHGALPWPVAHKAGWRRLPVRAAVPAGRVATKRSFEQGAKADEAVERLETVPQAEHDAAQAAVRDSEIAARLESDGALKSLCERIAKLEERVAKLEARQ